METLLFAQVVQESGQSPQMIINSIPTSRLPELLLNLSLRPFAASALPATATAKAAGTKFCTKCGTKNAAGTKFCTKCGAALTASTTAKFCAKCGTAVKANEKFCKKCGAKLT